MVLDPASIAQSPKADCGTGQVPVRLWFDPLTLKLLRGSSFPQSVMGRLKLAIVVDFK